MCPGSVCTDRTAPIVSWTIIIFHACNGYRAYSSTFTACWTASAYYMFDSLCKECLAAFSLYWPAIQWNSNNLLSFQQTGGTLVAIKRVFCWNRGFEIVHFLLLGLIKLSQHFYNAHWPHLLNWQQLMWTRNRPICYHQLECKWYGSSGWSITWDSIGNFLHLLELSWTRPASLLHLAWKAGWTPRKYWEIGVLCHIHPVLPTHSQYVVKCKRLHFKHRPIIQSLDCSCPD